MNSNYTELHELSSFDAIKYFNLSKKNLKKLGMEGYRDGKFLTINEIKKSSDGMITATAIKNSQIKVGNSIANIESGKSYVMPFGQFLSGKKNKVYKPCKKSFKELFKRYNGEDLTDKKVLIWRTGGLGDIIVAQSVCAAIKDKYPTCKITFATSQAFAPIFYSFEAGMVDELITVPFSVDVLKSNDYHITFIHAVENCKETETMNFYDSFQKISGLDYDAGNYVSKLQSIKSVKSDLSRMLPKNLIVLHLNATAKLRHVHPSFFKEAAKHLIDNNFSIGIIDAPNKAKEVSEFMKTLELPLGKLYNLAAVSKDVNYAVAICDLAMGGLCVDSAMGHVFGALRKPAMVICGPHPSYNICGRYPTILGKNPPENWNECGKYPCCFNAQDHLCPFLEGGQFPGCMNSNNPKDCAEELIKHINNFYGN